MRATEFIREADDTVNDNTHPVTKDALARGQQNVRREFSNKTQQADTRSATKVGPLSDISGWFKGILDKNTRARKAGEAEVRKFTNQHMTTFMKQMGRYNKDWPTLTLHVIYQYMRSTMHLSDDDIMHVINNVTGKQLSLQDVQDRAGKNRITSINIRGQDTAEKIIAAGALRQLERHWEKSGGNGAVNYGQTDANTSEPNADQPAAAQQDTAHLIKTGTIKKASDGNEYELDVSPVNTVWLRRDNGFEAPLKIAKELNKDAAMKEFKEFDGNLYDIIESATGGATASGSIASVANPMGAVISRTPNLFGYIPAETKPITKKRKNRRKSAH